MKRRQSSGPERKTTRRWHILPPLLHGTEALEGGDLLQEIPGELGVLLWQTLRDVMLWSTTPPADRGKLFAARAYARRGEALRAVAPEPVLEEPLGTLAEVLHTPETMQGEPVAVACRQVAQWAEGEGLLATAQAFAQNAALAGPADAAAAFQVGRLARARADHARAEGWFRRAIGLARQSRDWRMYSRAFGGLGNLYMRRGNFPAARRLHTRALRGARRGGLRMEQGAALHDLFGVAAETGRMEEAERYARAAFEAYGTRNGRIMALAHDVAYVWMDQGYFARALPVFQAVLPLTTSPVERMFALSDIARAAAGAGEQETARTAIDHVMSMLDQPETQEGVARALVELARAAYLLHDRDLTSRLAQRAGDVAAERREAKVGFVAEALLDSVRRPTSGAAQPQTRSAETAADEAAASAAAADAAAADAAAGEALAADFVRTLEAMAVAGG